MTGMTERKKTLAYRAVFAHDFMLQRIDFIAGNFLVTTFTPDIFTLN